MHSLWSPPHVHSYSHKYFLWALLTLGSCILSPLCPPSPTPLAACSDLSSKSWVSLHLIIKFFHRMKLHDDTAQVSFRAGQKVKKVAIVCKISHLYTHIHTHTDGILTQTHVSCEISLSCMPYWAPSRHCIIWVQDEWVYICYSNNRNSLYYSWVAGKTYGGISLVTFLFNITSPRLGTP